MATISDARAVDFLRTGSEIQNDASCADGLAEMQNDNPDVIIQVKRQLSCLSATPKVVDLSSSSSSCKIGRIRSSTGLILRLS